MGPAFSHHEAQVVFFPDEFRDRHTQWPFDVDDRGALDTFVSPFGPLPVDLGESQRMDADRLASLLDRIGRSIVVTHSASGPDGWLLADRRPGLVRAIVSVEPMGPAFATIPNIGSLTWGLTAAPLTYEPALRSPAEAREADPSTLVVPALRDLPVAVVTGGASPFAKNGPLIGDSLVVAGAAVEVLHLPEYGVHGNGHGLIYEHNSDEALGVVLAWLRRTVPA